MVVFDDDYRKEADLAYITDEDFPPEKSDFSTIEYDSPTKEKMLTFLKSVEWFGVCGLVIDCRTGETTKVEDLLYENDKYRWTTTEIYHIELYNAAVTDDFLNYIKNL